MFKQKFHIKKRQKTPDPDSLTSNFYQTFKKKSNTNQFPEMKWNKNRGEMNSPQLFLSGQHNPSRKLDKDITS